MIFEDVSQPMACLKSHRPKLGMLYSVEEVQEYIRGMVFVSGDGTPSNRPEVINHNRCIEHIADEVADAQDGLAAWRERKDASRE